MILLNVDSFSLTFHTNDYHFMQTSYEKSLITNDIGTRYQKNPDYNEILLVNSGKAISSGWKRKEKLAKIIRKELEKRI